MRKLVDLDPRFINQHGTDRTGVGVQFDCPCGCDVPCFVPFKNPLDGGPDCSGRSDGGWQRTGDTFETLTLTPSIFRKGMCGWHGYLTSGVLIPC